MWSYYLCSLKKNLNTLCYSPGFCHKQCATSSTVNMSEEIEFLIICKRCCETQAATRVESSNGSPTSPLLLQGRDFPNPVTATKHGKLVGCKGSSASFGTLEHSSEVKSTNRSAVAKKNRNLNWGLIWRKKNCEDTGIDFRLKNILLRGNTDRDLIKPLCHLCNQPYNADLMYIRCETCQRKFVLKRIYKIFISDHYCCLTLLFIVLFSEVINVFALCPLQIGFMLIL